MRRLILLLPLFLLSFPVEAQLVSGIDTTAIDHSVRPQDDFFRFVNGHWLDRTEIPADESRFGAFTELADEARDNIQIIIADAVAGRLGDDPDAARIAAAYTAYFDSTHIESLGITPLAPDFARIEAVQSIDDLISYFTESRRTIGSTPFGLGVGQDARQADQYAVSASQGGTTLPDQSYYFEDQFADIRASFLAYLEEIYELAGIDNPAERAQTFFDVETRLAEIQWTRVQSRDREATYNKIAVSELDAAHPNLKWVETLNALGMVTDSVIVRQPSFFDDLNNLVVEIPLDDWKTWLTGRLLNSTTSYLPQAFRDASFEFWGRTLAGQPEPTSRERAATGYTQGLLGEALGRFYVERHYPAEAAARMDDLIANLREAFRESILELDWMSDATKEEALVKLELFNTKIGHTTNWQDYSELHLSPDDLIGNVRAASVFRFNESVSRLGGPVDRERWGMTPQTVNAYYSPSLNEIVFPAGILQPPFFNVEADDAVNYGGIGAVIGHEFSHGFDDQGRRSDGHGNLRDWWTEEDAAEYTRRAQAIVDQYNAYEPLPGYNINGQLGLGENIADLAGLTMAYRAYRNSLNGEEPPIIDGLTGDQRFFMGWAQVWRVLHREEELRRRLIQGPHSPGEYRTNGIVPHLDAFYDAFDVEPGDEMYRAPEDRIRIW